MGTPRTMDELLSDHRARIENLERRRRGGGGGGGSSGGSGSYVAQAGLMEAFAGSIVPSGWLLCDGTAVGRLAYPALFQVIGTAWGAGDGSTTFNVPNLKGRALVGRDAGQTEFDVLGETGGAKTHTLAAQEIPDHGHAWAGGTGAASGAGDVFMRAAASGADGNFRTGAGITPTGVYGVGQISGSRAHNNLQPYAVANYIISTGSGVAGGGSMVPSLPDPKTAYTTAVNEAITMNWANTGWVDVPGCAITYTLPYPMWVDVEFAAQITTTNVATYGMIGVVATGALTLTPEQDQATGANPRWGNTPFSLSTQNVATHGTKLILLPAGTTTLTMQMRRSTTANDVYATYPTLNVTPLSWVGAAGASIASRSPQGQIPSSVVVGGGGSATVAADGTVNFLATSTLSLNDVFDGLDNDCYEIHGLVYASAEVGGALNMRLRNLGADLTNNYYGHVDYSVTTSWAGISFTGLVQLNVATWVIGFRQFTNFDITIKNPRSTTRNKEIQGLIASDGDNQVSARMWGRTAVIPGYSGITIYPNAAVTIGGWVKVVKV